ncbi:MAG: hypothetical protein PHW77_05035 [Eubacteriales bacterium]|nr:hypothetical protein [Eubacteriales bacterium]
MKKQLILTVIFLLISISVLGVASYAWFSANDKVTASGMQVSVDVPINVMASLDAPASVTSLEGFASSFSFGTLQTEDDELHISEYDMLVPVTSADGIHFAYLPFRYVASNGCPKVGTTLSDYQLIGTASNIGYYIDISLYLTTTNYYNLNLYVKSINISDPTGNNTITGAVRCAVLKKVSDSYDCIVYAKDSAAAPLASADDIYYPLISDGAVLSESISDTPGYESEYYISHPLEDNPYIPSESNTITVRACEKVGGIITYYTTEVRLRIWVEGTDSSAVFANAGSYFAVSVEIAVNED